MQRVRADRRKTTWKALLSAWFPSKSNTEANASEPSEKAMAQSAVQEAIALSPDEQNLHSQVVPEIGAYFAAKRCRLFILSQLPRKASDLFQKALSPEYNPVLNYLSERHAPVHEEIVLSASKWQAICPRFDHGHVLLGPIVVNGTLIGGLGVTRDPKGNGASRQRLEETLHPLDAVSAIAIQPRLPKEISAT